jgi:hypothetical protein
MMLKQQDQELFGGFIKKQLGLKPREA